eukprot:1548654-Rhodomonas_salina.2
MTLSVCPNRSLRRCLHTRSPITIRSFGHARPISDDGRPRRPHLPVDAPSAASPVNCRSLLLAALPQADRGCCEPRCIKLDIEGETASERACVCSLLF